MPVSSETLSNASRALDRARVYRGLSQLFREPEPVRAEEVREQDLPELCGALLRLAADDELLGEARELFDGFGGADLEDLHAAYRVCFDESSSKRCAATEMDQLGGAPQLELTRTFEMADVAGFYRAFGVEVSGEGERPDHISAELEFMNLLAVKECVALQDESSEHAEVCRDASRSFLRDHLLRFAPRLGARLDEADAHPVYSAAGRLLAGFVEFDAELVDAQGAPKHRLSPESREEGTPAS